MPKRTDEFKSQQERLILDAARRCFVEQGYDRTTLRDIARVAGLSTGALYVYFQAKDALLVAICQEQAAQQQVALARALQDASTGQLAFDALFRAALQPFLDTPDEQVRQREQLNLLFWYESTRDPRLGQTLQRLIGQWHGAIMARVAAAQAEGLVAADLDPDALASILIAVPFGLQLYDLLRQQTSNRAAWLHTLGTALNRGLLTPTPIAAPPIVKEPPE